uniref:Cytochrome b561 domain-containing protein n=1 Tax=Haemonchus contortus TaxID=6289 RepID=A0A7I4Z021_HAECO
MNASMAALPEDLSKFLFKLLFGISQASGALMIILATIWMDLYDYNGIWTGLSFRYHPVLMAFAIYLMGNSIMMFRILRAQKKWIATVAHVIVHSCAIFVMCLGAFVVWNTYTSIDEATASATPSNKPPGPQPFLRYYSFHTWLGLATISLYIVQYIGGIMINRHPNTDIRRTLKSFHQLSGLVLFGTTILTASFGTSQQASWKSICSSNGETGQHILSNVFAISFITFSGSVFLLVCNPRWRREEKLATTDSTAVFSIGKVSAYENHANLGTTNF